LRAEGGESGEYFVTGEGFGGRHDEDRQSFEGRFGRGGGGVERRLERGKIGFHHATGNKISSIGKMIGVGDQGAVALIVNGWEISHSKLIRKFKRRVRGS
jgi:hypothetical protein